MKNYKGVQVGQTLNVLFKGLQVTAMVIYKSRVNIEVRFFNPIELNQEVYRSFTTKGVIRYMKGENSKILSLSL